MLYTLVTKLNSTWSTLLKVDLKVDKVDRVALAPYTLVTKLLTVPATMSTELATILTATRCRIQVVADTVDVVCQNWQQS